MARVTVVVCDLDEPDVRRDAKTYRVTVDGKSYTADLCDEHAGPLLQIIGLGKPSVNPTTTRGTSRRRGITAKMTTVEDIEAAKRKTRKAK